MKYVVTDINTGKEETFEVDEAYKALVAFRRAHTDVDIDAMSIRSYGGSDVPAKKLWPRLR